MKFMSKIAVVIAIIVALISLNYVRQTKIQNDQLWQQIEEQQDREETNKQFQKELQENTKFNFPSQYVGKFSITHYCDCPICTGTKKGSHTATGHKPRQGRTIAVDPKIIPLHSIVYIEGMGYFVAEDTGGAIKKNHIDVYVDDHEEAKRLGTLGGRKKKVWVMKQVK